MRIKTIWFFPILALFIFVQNIHAADIQIGTGGTGGVYYPTGGDICDLVNDNPDIGLSCEALSTGGSVYNIDTVLSGGLQFGIAQSDTHYYAWNGLNNWLSAGPQNNLRSVFSLHPESVTLITAANSGIVSLSDIVGKVVNLLPETSGGRQTINDILDFAGIDYSTDLTATTYSSGEAYNRFLNDEIDAFFVVIGHPSSFITNITQGAKQVRFIPIVNMEGLISSAPYYTESTIPNHYYPDIANTEDVHTIGIRATLITSANVTDDYVYAITSEIFKHFIEFKNNHLTRETLTRNVMLQALTAPIHPGAMKYYKEVIFKNIDIIDINFDYKTGHCCPVKILQMRVNYLNI